MRARNCKPGCKAAPGSRSAPTVQFPAWMDGRYTMLTSEVRSQVFVTRAQGSAAVVPGNSARWAIGFKNVSGAGAVLCDPTTNDGTGGWLLDIAGNPIWFSLFEFGPLVCMPWYLTEALAVNVRVYEVVLL